MLRLLLEYTSESAALLKNLDGRFCKIDLHDYIFPNFELFVHDPSQFLYSLSPEERYELALYMKDDFDAVFGSYSPTKNVTLWVVETPETETLIQSLPCTSFSKGHVYKYDEGSVQFDIPCYKLHIPVWSDFINSLTDSQATALLPRIVYI